MGRILTEISDSVAVVVISAPPMNALDAQMRETLASLLKDLQQDDSVRAIMLKGDGKAFCAGFDLKELQANLGSVERSLAQLNSDAILFERLENCQKPTVAAVDGVAFGGGLELATCCDFILASGRSRFALPEIKIGAIPAAGGTVRTTRMIGPARCRQMILLGEAIDAATALNWGLITRLIDAERFDREAEDFIRHLAELPARALQYAKRAIRSAERDTDSVAHKLARDYAARLAISDDLAEGVKSFLEKRRPIFTDKPDPES